MDSEIPGSLEEILNNTVLAAFELIRFFYMLGP
jgi:hypothetical protein